MLLEEALAGNNPSTPIPANALTPHDEALAILSFIRDELPAGGTAAEKRFVNLLPLIVNRVFGEWNNVNDNNNVATPDGGNGGSPGGGGGARSPVTLSPGGSRYSSPANGNGGASPSGTATAERDYRHAEGGWLGVYSSPVSSQQQQQSSGANGSRSGGLNRSTNTATTASRSSSSSSTSLDHDPITRLLRAPRNQQSRSSDTSTSSTYYPPTLLDALSAESQHRPHIKFKFPLGGLVSTLSTYTGASASCVEDWKVCFWNELEKEMNTNNNNAAASSSSSSSGNGASASNSGGRGGFGMHGDPQNQTHEAKSTSTTAAGSGGVVGKENATRIIQALLSGGLSEQLELHLYFTQLLYHQQQQQGCGTSISSGSSSSTGFASPLKSRTNNSGYNTTPNTTNNTPSSMMSMTTTTTTTINETNLQLTMMEYYLFLFVRFPLANTSWSAQLEDLSRRQRQYGKRLLSPYGQRVYSYLFTSYMNCYLSHDGKGSSSCAGGSNYLGVGVDCFDGSSGSGTGSSALLANSFDRTSELFLRLLIEFWIEGSNIAPTTSQSCERYRRVRTGVATASSTSNNNMIHPTLSDALELTQPFQGSFAVPPSSIQIGVLNLVRHLVSDKSMWELVKGVSTQVQQQQREDYRGSSTRVGTPTLVGDNDVTSGSSAASQSSDTTPTATAVASWCLPPAMTATQPSIFNYIRLGLACGTIHDRTSIFHRALETWLVWLEPWNYILKRRLVATNRSGSGVGSGSGANGGGRGQEFLRNAAATVSSVAQHKSGQHFEYYPSYVQPKPNTPSKYTAQWEAYIVANAHFYTVPLAIFLKRARELDFSSSVEYPRSLALMQRVLRIYSKNVVSVLNSVLNSRADGLSTSLFAKHQTNMGPYCPSSSWKLMDCQVDATNLLEEVFGQHQKRKAAMDFFDRMDAKMNALFDGKIGGSEEAALDTLLVQVRYLVNLPLDYQVLPEEMPAAKGFGLWRLLGLGSNGVASADKITSVDLLAPQRGSDGKLTDLGRQQLYAGLCKCNPIDVGYIGDPMLARVKSYEVPALVELMIRLSNYLNRKLGFVAPQAPADGGDLTGDDDILLKHFREMEEYQNISFRINLRFLADSRNIIFGAIVWWVFSTVRSLFA